MKSCGADERCSFFFLYYKAQGCFSFLKQSFLLLVKMTGVCWIL